VWSTQHQEERTCPRPCVVVGLSLSGSSCEKPGSQGVSPLSRPALRTGSCELFRAVHAKSPPFGRGMSPHAVEKQPFFQEESLGTRPVPGPVRCPTSRRCWTPKRSGGSSRPGRRFRPAARGAAALTTAATPAYFTKRPVGDSCYFGKMVGSGRCSRSNGVAVGLIRRKAGFRVFRSPSGSALSGSRQELCVAVRHRRTNRKLDVGLPYLPWNSNTSRQRETRDGQCRHSTAISRSAISC